MKTFKNVGFLLLVVVFIAVLLLMFKQMMMTSPNPVLVFVFVAVSMLFPPVVYVVNRKSNQASGWGGLFFLSFFVWNLILLSEGMVFFALGFFRGVL